MAEIYDTIIIGNGPAGLTAAIYAVRAGFKTLVVSDNPMGGGQIATTYEVANYPGLNGIGGAELGEKFEEHAKALGAEFLTARVSSIEGSAEEAENPGAAGSAQATGFQSAEKTAYAVNTASESPKKASGKSMGLKTVATDKGNLLTRTVVIATGADHRKLGVPGETEFTGSGVSYCATCDGAFFKNKTVAVVGGGDVALEDAIFLSRFASKVYIIHRRDEFRGAYALQQQVFANEKIEVIYDSVVTEVTGKFAVESLKLHNRKTEEDSVLPVNGVFMAVGIQPNLEGIEGLPERNEAGYIKAGEDCVTSIAGIYAAGDVRTKALRQVITACADGANAVTSISAYFNGE